jgi:hypothetical protein
VAVADSSLPPELSAGLPQLLSGLVRLLLDLKEQQEAAAEAAEDEDEEDPDEVRWGRGLAGTSGHRKQPALKRAKIEACWLSVARSAQQ